MSKKVKLHPVQGEEVVEEAVEVNPELETIIKFDVETIQAIREIKDTYVEKMKKLDLKSEDAKKFATAMPDRLDFITTSLQQGHMLMAFPNGFNIQQSFSDIVPSGNAIILISTKDKG